MNLEWFYINIWKKARKEAEERAKERKKNETREQSISPETGDRSDTNNGKEK